MDEDWVGLSLKIVKLVDRKTGKEYDEYHFALKEHKAGAMIIYSDLEGVALCTNGEFYLIDSCGNALFIDRSKYRILTEYDGKSSYRCKCLTVNCGALLSINLGLRGQLRLLHRNALMKIPGKYSASKSRRDSQKERQESAKKISLAKLPEIEENESKAN